jgi:hypothetical protein
MNYSKLALAGVSYYQISGSNCSRNPPPSLTITRWQPKSKVQVDYVIKKSNTTEMFGSELGGFSAYHRL